MHDRESSTERRTQVRLTPDPSARRAQLVLGVLPAHRRERRVERLRRRAVTSTLTVVGVAVLALAVTLVEGILLPSLSSGAPPSLWIPPAEFDTASDVQARSTTRRVPEGEWRGLGRGEGRPGASAQVAQATRSADPDRLAGRTTDDRSGEAASDDSGVSGSDGTGSHSTAEDGGAPGAGGVDDQASADDRASLTGSESSGRSNVSGDDSNDDESPRSGSSGSGSDDAGSSGSGDDDSGSSGSGGGDDSGSSGSGDDDP